MGVSTPSFPSRMYARSRSGTDARYSLKPASPTSASLEAPLSSFSFCLCLQALDCPPFRSRSKPKLRDGSALSGPLGGSDCTPTVCPLTKATSKWCEQILRIESSKLFSGVRRVETEVDPSRRNEVDGWRPAKVKLCSG